MEIEIDAKVNNFESPDRGSVIWSAKSVLPNRLAWEFNNVDKVSVFGSIAW